MTRVTLSRLPGDRVLVVDGDLERADDCDDPIVLVRNAPNPAALGSYFAVAKDDSRSAPGIRGYYTRGARAGG